jgi:hypothetical protein
MKTLRTLTSVLIVILFLGCDTNESKSSTHTANPTLSVTLVDAPGDYAHVYVDIVDVMVKYDSDAEENEDDDENGWISLDIIEPGIYDLLELTGGVNLPLVENEEIEPGIIKQIRLVLGNSNSIVFNGETEERPLTTPSAQQSGLKVFVNQQVLPGFNYNFILDFDADDSIVIAGNSGNIILKPVLRANLEINSGIIQGNVLPLDVMVGIEVSNDEVSASTMTDDFGNFEISGLPEGIYTVTLTPDENSLFEPVIINDVEVTAGNITDLGTIQFE